MSRTRIWFVRTALDAIGGAERVIAKVMRSLPEERFEVSAIWLYTAGAYGEELQREGIRTFSGLGTSRTDLRLPVRLIQLARRERPDIVFTTENALACFWAGLLKRWGLCRRLVIGFHVTQLSRRSYQIAVRLAAPVADKLVALSETHLHHWQTFTQLPRERFVVIPNGVDTTRYVPLGSKQAHRFGLGLPSDACTIGLVAYLKPVKNLPLFVEVANRVISMRKDVHFVLVGDGPERLPTEQTIQERKLESFFTFVGAVDDTAPWHQAFDIFLLTSHSEALPMAILEANSCAVPAVATDVGGVRDVIVHGKTGFYAPAGDADSLTRHVLTLCTDAVLRERMGHAARQHVVVHFSEEAMVRRYAELFEQLAQRRTTAATAHAPEK